MYTISTVYLSIADPIIRVAPGVVFHHLGAEFFVVCAEMARIADRYGVTPTITGASGAPVYEHEPLHQIGHAWDWRSRDFFNPQKVTDELSKALEAIDPHYRVVYIAPPKAAHIHVEYRADD